MPKFIIEREAPGVGMLSSDALQDMSRKSCDVIEQMGPQIQWVQSYVTADKLYCVYIAPDEAAIREHARKGGFPVNKIERVKTMIDPALAV